MNLAFLVEGTTELKLYPKWIKHFSSKPFTECATGYQDVIANQFTIFNVAGIGKMSHEIPAAINAIIANPVFDYLVIVIDADANNIHPNLTLIQNIVADPTTPTLPVNCNVKIIVQQVCIETWFIGHTDAYLAAKACRDRGIFQLMTEYDAQNNDPEMMPNNRSAIVHSIGAYHAAFLKKMLKGANRTWNYGKSTADTLIDTPYLERLEKRLIDSPTHLQTFSDMVTFLKSI